jgi:hypothetical protein
MKTITVSQPNFFIKKDDPSTVSYHPEEPGIFVTEDKNYPWRPIQVQTYNEGLPEPKENEILYKYTETRGFLLARFN